MDASLYVKVRIFRTISCLSENGLAELLLYPQQGFPIYVSPFEMPRIQPRAAEQHSVSSFNQRLNISHHGVEAICRTRVWLSSSSDGRFNVGHCHGGY